MKKLFTSFLSLGVLLLSSPAQAASAFDPVGHQSLPLLGSACSKSGSIIKNSYFQFTCSNKSGSTIWTGTASKYKAPVNYLKGYALGQALKKANPTVGNGSLVCKNSADGYVVKSFEIQAGSISSSNKTILNVYFDLQCFVREELRDLRKYCFCFSKSMAITTCKGRKVKV